MGVPTKNKTPKKKNMPQVPRGRVKQLGNCMVISKIESNQISKNQLNPGISRHISTFTFPSKTNQNQLNPGISRCAFTFNFSPKTNENQLNPGISNFPSKPSNKLKSKLKIT